ncbi:hypothetical protein Krac_5543 [Ktedonobacter racemifer DSM 44963]|uniref:Uncharacterized protein n=1 Tax=Ktedonobacter racemifer DSM 44963 TaxID=485913 RepID=D6TWA2_KTERA|nr:hypothetical protein Krac_5543 [Ktedonobacter racemifer DSM 44963]
MKTIFPLSTKQNLYQCIIDELITKAVSEPRDLKIYNMWTKRALLAHHSPDHFTPSPSWFC